MRLVMVACLALRLLSAGRHYRGCGEEAGRQGETRIFALRILAFLATARLKVEGHASSPLLI